jgi:hypothetical protein
MKKILIITPMKDSIELTELTIRSVMNGFNKELCDYVVYDDFSTDENAFRLDELSTELGFNVVHLRDILTTPSPNYRYVLQMAQQQAIHQDSHLVIVESDVVINTDTIQRLLSAAADNIGLVASVTVDESGAVNFPYLFARNWKNVDVVTKKRFSFCCTLLTNNFLKSYDFALLNPTKNWYDVFISHKSVELGFKNILQMTNRVLHRPHSSRPWKLLKYTNPLKYYWIKYTKGFDKI